MTTQTNGKAERASSEGCPKCNSSDIDLDDGGNDAAIEKMARAMVSA